MLRRALRESKQAAEQRTSSPSLLEQASSKRRESYYWHGHRYEIDEDTRPEWIDAGRRKSSKPSTPKLSNASTPTSNASQGPDTLIVKLRVPMAAQKQYAAPVAQMVAPTAPMMMPSSTTNYAAILVSTRKPWTSFWDFDPQVRDVIYRHATRTGSVIEVNWQNGPPFLHDVPVISRLNRQTRQECLPIFYRENMFECPFHNTLYKFIKQIPKFVLPHLRSVRLSHPLGYAGFVRTLLNKLNESTEDGMKSGVVKVAMTVEGELATAIVGLEDLDAFDGIEGDWHGLKVARRKIKPTIEKTEVVDSSDDEDESPVIKSGRKRKRPFHTSEEDDTEADTPVTRPRMNRKRASNTSEEDDTEDEPPNTRPKRNRKRTWKLNEEDDDAAEEAMIAYERRKAAAKAATPVSRPQHPSLQPSAKQGSRGPRVELRKPDSMSEERWDGLPKDYKALHSHAGRILETEAGQLRAGGPCGRCIRLNKAPEECREYTKRATQQYDSRTANGRCAHCRLAKAKCEDFTVDDSDDDDYEPPAVRSERKRRRTWSIVDDDSDE